MNTDLCKAVYAAAANVGLLHECTWRQEDVMVGLFRSDHTVLDHLTQSSDTCMTYPASCLQGLKPGEKVLINHRRYQVREVVAIGDGSEMRATLTQL